MRDFVPNCGKNGRKPRRAAAWLRKVLADFASRVYGIGAP
jgi:hypothetical protein